jgi:Zn-dependent protease with chaperone function
VLSFLAPSAPLASAHESVSESAKLSAIGQRYLPRDRESFLDAQQRNRRATWRISVLCVTAAVVMGIPLALTITPLLYAVVLIGADIINYFSPLPQAFWQLATEFARSGFVALGWLLEQKPADPQSLALGAAVMLLPGVLLSLSLWLAISLLFRRCGVGGALLALNAREPKQTELKELQLADVVEEMAIAAGVKPPGVMLIDSPGANAAVIGSSPADARVIVSRRLLDDLNRDQLEGILAHLIASIGNGDLKIAFRITTVFETCGLLVALINSPFGPRSRRVLWRIVRYGFASSTRDGDAQEAAAVADLLARNVGLETDDIDEFFDTTRKSRLRSIRNFIFFPIFFTNAAIKLSLWFFSSAVLGPSVALLWHTRQYLADASAVQLTRNPDGLATALQLLNEEPGEIPGGDWAAHLFVASPKSSDHNVSAVPDRRQREILAQAWAASGPQTSETAKQAVPNFPALQSQFSTTLRAALSGDAQAIARLRAVYQVITAADPALAAQIPNPDDFIAARQGNAAAMFRMRGLHQPPASQTQAKVQKEASSISSVSMLGFHPSMKRRLKRLARMGAHVDLAAVKSKAWIVVTVLSVILAPFVLMLIALFLLLIAIMTMASLAFLVIWLAVIHNLFGLLAHH